MEPPDTRRILRALVVDRPPIRVQTSAID